MVPRRRNRRHRLTFCVSCAMRWSTLCARQLRRRYSRICGAPWSSRLSAFSTTTHGYARLLLPAVVAQRRRQSASVTRVNISIFFKISKYFLFIKISHKFCNIFQYFSKFFNIFRNFSIFFQISLYFSKFPYQYRTIFPICLKKACSLLL